MAKSSMKKNRSVKKVSERALEQKRLLEEEELEAQKKKASKESSMSAVKDAMYSSVGGLLTIVSLLFGLYGLLSIPALWLCYKGLQKNKDYGWRGMILPGICIVINVAWIIFQIVMIFSPEIRVWYYNWLSEAMA